MCVLAGCGGTAVPMAPEPSPHFETVSRELQLGGTAYVYADIDGDAERASDFLLSLLRDLPELAPTRGTTQINAKSLVRILGLDSVRAIGLSSYSRGELFHNRSFLHHTGAPRGLLRLVGNEPTELRFATSAPAGADLVLEQQLDVGVVLEIVRELSRLGVGISPEDEPSLPVDDRVLGDELQDLVVDEDLEPLAAQDLVVTLGQLLESLQTTVGVILEVDESRNLWFPGEPLTFPYTDFVIALDGLEALGDAIIARASSDPFIRSKRMEGFVIISPAIRLPPHY